MVYNSSLISPNIVPEKIIGNSYMIFFFYNLMSLIDSNVLILSFLKHK